MTFEAGSGGGGTLKPAGVRQSRDRSIYATAPSAPYSPPSAPTEAPGDTGRRKGKNPRRGGTGASGAEARAVARENAAKKKAADRYREQAENLNVQADALRRALRRDFRKGLQSRIANIDLVLGQQNRLLTEGYQERYDQLKGAASDNEQAAGGQSNINLLNMARERLSAISEAMSMGAGESDVMRAQMMALRNWNANQTEVNRGYFDTLRSINSSLTDLNVDTKNARMNLQTEANADKEQIWTDYYNRRSETFTQLGNVLGQQADYYSMAKEMGGKGDKGRAKRQAGRAFQAASRESGRVWENPGVGERLRAWDGKPEFDPALQPADPRRADRTTSTRLDRPRRGRLRSW